VEDMNMQDLSIIFAACLHDIGKFHRRTGKRESHETLSAEFVEMYVPEFEGKELVKNIVAGHHEKPMDEATRIVKEADSLSAAERRELEEGYEHEMRRLRYIFASHNFFYRIGPLDLRDYELLKGDGVEKSSTKEYWVLWERFIEDVKLLRDLYPDGVNDESFLRHYIKTFSELSRRYTFLIPSAPTKEVEVRNSLYAHHKTSAALASSIIINKKMDVDCRFTILLGDVAGIQKYVYGSRMYKGALKMLRSRSIYLSILTEAIARHIVNRLGLLPLNIIFSSGGHFMILAHYIGEEELERTLGEVERFLIREQGGLVGLKLSYTYIDEGDFMDRERFKDKLGEARRGLGESSLRLFKRIMYHGFDRVFGPIPVGEDVCYSCGRAGEVRREREDREEIYICEKCCLMRELAKELKDANYVVAISWSRSIARPEELSIDRPGEGVYTGPLNLTVNGLSVSYHLCKDLEAALRLIDMFMKQELKPIDVDIYKINDTDISRELEMLKSLSEKYGDIVRRVSLGFRFIPKHTPISREGSIRDFDDMAEASRGSKMIGYLKLDIDGLGEKLKQYCETFSDFLTFSETVSFIMEGCIEHMLSTFFEENDMNRLYLIYSGGDDLFLVGSWDAVVEATEMIYGRLRGVLRMDHGGPTVSAAIDIEDPKTPVKVCSEIVSEKLKKVKSEGKNGVMIIGRKTSWSGFINSLETARKISEYIENGIISRSFIFQLSRLISDYERDPEKAWTTYRYRLKYIIARSFGEDVKEELEGRLIRDFRTDVREEIQRRIFENFIYLTNISYLAELYTRVEG
jgi:CRISPR-associated protein Csm1